MDKSLIRDIKSLINFQDKTIQFSELEKNHVNYSKINHLMDLFYIVSHFIRNNGKYIKKEINRFYEKKKGTRYDVQNTEIFKEFKEGIDSLLNNKLSNEELVSFIIKLNNRYNILINNNIQNMNDKNTPSTSEIVEEDQAIGESLSFNVFMNDNNESNETDKKDEIVKLNKRIAKLIEYLNVNYSKSLWVRKKINNIQKVQDGLLFNVQTDREEINILNNHLDNLLNLLFKKIDKDNKGTNIFRLFRPFNQVKEESLDAKYTKFKQLLKEERGNNFLLLRKALEEKLPKESINNQEQQLAIKDDIIIENNPDFQRLKLLLESIDLSDQTIVIDDRNLTYQKFNTFYREGILEILGSFKRQIKGLSYYEIRTKFIKEYLSLLIKSVNNKLGYIVHGQNNTTVEHNIKWKFNIEDIVKKHLDRLSDPGKLELKEEDPRDKATYQEILNNSEDYDFWQERGFIDIMKVPKHLREFEYEKRRLEEIHEEDGRKVYEEFKKDLRNKFINHEKFVVGINDDQYINVDLELDNIFDNIELKYSNSGYRDNEFYIKVINEIKDIIGNKVDTFIKNNLDINKIISISLHDNYKVLERITSSLLKNHYDYYSKNLMNSNSRSKKIEYMEDYINLLTLIHNYIYKPLIDRYPNIEECTDKKFDNESLKVRYDKADAALKAYYEELKRINSTRSQKDKESYYKERLDNLDMCIETYRSTMFSDVKGLTYNKSSYIISDRYITKIESLQKEIKPSLIKRGFFNATKFLSSNAVIKDKGKDIGQFAAIGNGSLSANSLFKKQHSMSPSKHFSHPVKGFNSV